MQLPRFLSRFARLTPAILALLMLVSPASGQETPSPPPAGDTVHFLIETITVETDREASARIVKAGTLLREGESYTEDDLRQAISRVHRLPFVLDATFSLRKGSQRGAYELVIQASTARWFFFDRGVQLAWFNRLSALGPSFYTSDRLSIGQTGLIGARTFIGRSGLLYGSIGFQDDKVTDGNGAQIGYTQYDLFGRGIVANVSFALHDCCSTEIVPFGIDPDLTAWDWDDDQQAALSLSIPLAPHRSIQLGWTERRGDAGLHRSLLIEDRYLATDAISAGDQSSRQAFLRWAHNTADDPILPTRGTEISAGLEYASYEADGLSAYRFLPDENTVILVPLPDFQGEQLVAAVNATHHWSLTPRQSVSAIGRISAGRSRTTNLVLNRQVLPETDLDVFGGSIGARHLLRLWTLREPGNLGDLYLETEAHYGIESTSPDLGLPENPLQRLELSTSLNFRNRWGRLRLLVSYLDLGGAL